MLGSTAMRKGEEAVAEFVINSVPETELDKIRQRFTEVSATRIEISRNPDGTFQITVEIPDNAIDPTNPWPPAGTRTR
jgi:hypothetical protein